MADQTFQKPVLDHARIAMITPDLVPTRPAQRDGRIPTTVDEQHRLLTSLQPLVHLGA